MGGFGPFGMGGGMGGMPAGMGGMGGMPGGFARGPPAQARQAEPVEYNFHVTVSEGQETQTAEVVCRRRWVVVEAVVVMKLDVDLLVDHVMFQLEDLYNGTTKKMRINKKAYDAATGRVVPVSVDKEIPIKYVRQHSRLRRSDTYLQRGKCSPHESTAGLCSYTPRSHTPVIGTEEIGLTGARDPPCVRFCCGDHRKGWKNGTKITYEKEGDELPGVIPADIIFILNTKPHPRFERDGNDLVYTATVPLADALTGVKVDIQTLDGRTIT